MVFEVQQNSDITFRLYDWGHVDAKTGKPRALKSIRHLPALISERRGRSGDARGGGRRRRWSARGSFIANRSGCGACGESPFSVGAAGVPRVLVCIEGTGQIEHEGDTYAVGKGTYGSCRR